MPNFKVKKVWTLIMKSGTHSSFSQELYFEPDEKTLLDFINTIQINKIPINNNKIEVLTSWEIEKE